MDQETKDKIDKIVDKIAPTPVRGMKWLDYEIPLTDQDVRDLRDVGNLIEQYHKETGGQLGILAQLVFYKEGIEIRYRSVTWDQYLELAPAFLSDAEIKRLEGINERNSERKA